MILVSTYTSFCRYPDSSDDYAVSNAVPLRDDTATLRVLVTQLPRSLQPRPAFFQVLEQMLESVIDA
jgi:hypothetical protein